MFLRAVLWPFAWTRFLLAGVAWFGTQASVSWTYPVPEAARRGWQFHAATWLDAFGRWDAAWYLGIASDGYAVRGPLASVQSNVAFFPLFPWTIRLVRPLFPAGDGGAYLAALAVANGAAVAGLWVLWLLARHVADEETASRTVLYALLFPTGFVLSSAYPESLFLLLSAGALLAGLGGRFLLAGALGFLLALSRPGGVLVAIPLAWLAWTQGGARRAAGLAAAALPGAGLLLHAGNLWRVTGDPLALFHAQAAWGRAMASPWRTLTNPRYFHPFMGPLEAAALGFVALGGAWLVARRETRALGIWALVSVVPPLLSGTFVSSVRFAGVAFPALLALAMAARRPAVDRAVVVGFSFAQAVLFLFWSRFFWVA